jgi:hypothetical protein
MIRRLFWLSLGAALGVACYRRAASLARALSPGRGAGGLAGFAADVREGMALYMERHSGDTPSTLEGHPRNGPARGRRALHNNDEQNNDQKDGR